MDHIQNNNYETRLKHASINIYYDAGKSKQQLLDDLKLQVQTVCAHCRCFAPQFQNLALKVIEKPVTELKALEILSEEPEGNPCIVCPTTSDDEYQQLGRELELRVMQRAKYVFNKYFSPQDSEGDSRLLNAEERLRLWVESSHEGRVLSERLLQASQYEPSKKPCLTARYSPPGGIFALATDPYYQKNYRADLINFGWPAKLTLMTSLDDLFFAGISNQSVVIANFMEDQYNLTYAMPNSTNQEVIPFVDRSSKDMWGVINGDKVLTYKLDKVGYLSDLNTISIKKAYLLRDNTFTEGFTSGAFISVNNGPCSMALAEKIVHVYQADDNLKEWNSGKIYNISNTNPAHIRAMEPDSFKSGHLLCGGKQIVSIIDLENYTSWRDNEIYRLGSTIIQHIATYENLLLACDKWSIGLFDRSQADRPIWQVERECIGLGIHKEVMIIGSEQMVSFYDIRNLATPISSFNWSNPLEGELTCMTIAKDAILLSYGKSNTELIRLMCDEPKVSA